jgi:hypothetical protein
MTSYFEEAVNTGQPIVPPTPPVTPASANVQFPMPTGGAAPSNQAAPIQTEFKGLPVRAMGDRIFIILKGKKYWVTSGEVYTRLGFKFGDEVKIDQETLDVLAEGEPIR